VHASLGESPSCDSRKMCFVTLQKLIKKIYISFCLKFWADNKNLAENFWRDESSMLFRLETYFRDRLIQRRINSVVDKCLTISISSRLLRNGYRDQKY
jgi:hypothetical protein